MNRRSVENTIWETDFPAGNRKERSSRSTLMTCSGLTLGLGRGCNSAIGHPWPGPRREARDRLQLRPVVTAACGGNRRQNEWIKNAWQNCAQALNKRHG